ncbi:hypothetical protein COBT_002028 [Conglomerata obtusa]
MKKTTISHSDLYSSIITQLHETYADTLSHDHTKGPLPNFITEKINRCFTDTTTICDMIANENAQTENEKNNQNESKNDIYTNLVKNNTVYNRDFSNNFAYKRRRNSNLIFNKNYNNNKLRSSNRNNECNSKDDPCDLTRTWRNTFNVGKRVNTTAMSNFFVDFHARNEDLFANKKKFFRKAILEFEMLSEEERLEERKRGRAVYEKVVGDELFITERILMARDEKRKLEKRVAMRMYNDLRSKSKKDDAKDNDSTKCVIDMFKEEDCENLNNKDTDKILNNKNTVEVGTNKDIDEIFENADEIPNNKDTDEVSTNKDTNEMFNNTDDVDNNISFKDHLCNDINKDPSSVDTDNTNNLRAVLLENLAKNRSKNINKNNSQKVDEEYVCDKERNKVFKELIEFGVMNEAHVPCKVDIDRIINTYDNDNRDFVAEFINEKMSKYKFHENEDKIYYDENNYDENDIINTNNDKDTNENKIEDKSLTFKKNNIITEKYDDNNPDFNVDSNNSTYTNYTNNNNLLNKKVNLYFTNEYEKSWIDIVKEKINNTESLGIGPYSDYYKKISYRKHSLARKLALPDELEFRDSKYYSGKCFVNDTEEIKRTGPKRSLKDYVKNVIIKNKRMKRRTVLTKKIDESILKKCNKVKDKNEVNTQKEINDINNSNNTINTNNDN